LNETFKNNFIGAILAWIFSALTSYLAVLYYTYFYPLAVITIILVSAGIVMFVFAFINIALEYMKTVEIAKEKLDN